jgi:hypothetical protein
MTKDKDTISARLARLQPRDAMLATGLLGAVGTAISA